MTTGPARRRARAAALVVGVLLGAPTPRAHADERTDQAASLLRLGEGALTRGEHAVAVASFDQSEALVPSVAARLGAARALAASGRIVAARKRALDALALAPTTPDTADDADGQTAQLLAASLAPRIATLFVRVVPPDAALAVDGAPAEATRTIELDPGEHVAVATRAGRARTERKIRLGDGERAEIEIALPVLRAAAPSASAVPSSSAAPPASTAPGTAPTDDAPLRAPPLAVVGFLGAVAGLAVGVPFGVATINTLTSCPDTGCEDETKDDAAVTGGVAIAGLSVFAIGLTVGIVTLVVDDGAAETTARAITCPDRQGFCLAF